MKILKKIILIIIFLSFCFFNIVNAVSQEIIEDNPNLNLENLAVENMLLYPPFNAYILNYDIEVPNDMDNLNVLAVPQNEQSKVTITGATNLKEGKNKIIITVKSLSGQTRQYIINAYKRNVAEEESYIQKKEEQQLQLQSLYDTQKLVNNDMENGYKTERMYNSSQSNKTQGIKSYMWVIIISIIIAVGITLFAIKRKK